VGRAVRIMIKENVVLSKESIINDIHMMSSEVNDIKELANI